MSVTVRPAEVVMETVPFIMKSYLEPKDMNLEMLEEVVREIIRKAVKFGIIEYDKGEKLEKVAKNLAEEIIREIRERVKSFCEPSRRMIRRVAIVRKTLDLNVGKVNLKFVLINDGENCGIRLIEIQ